MKQKTLVQLSILVVLLIVLGVAWSTQYSRYKPYIRYLLGLEWKPEPEEFRTEQLAAPPGELVTIDSVQKKYRLSPDRRFVLAAAEVHHLLTGMPRKDAEVRFQDGRWRITVYGQDAGFISELPEYQEMALALRSFAGGLLKTHPFKSEQIQMDNVERAIAALDGPGALREVDRLWNTSGPNAVLIPAAAQAYVILSLESLDYLVLADDIRARALALLSISKSINPEALNSEECLLASLLGYKTFAKTAASHLSESDPVRLYVLRKDRELDSFVSKPSAPLLPRYLFLLRLAETRNAKEFETRRPNLFPVAGQTELALLKASLIVDEFSWIESVGNLIAVQAMHEVSGNEKPPSQRTGILPMVRSLLEMQKSSLIKSFHTELDRKSKLEKGPFMDPQIFRGYYAGHFYSGLWACGEFYRNQLSSVESTVEFANALGKHKDGIESEFSRFYNSLAVAKQGKASPGMLINDLQEFKLLGAPAFISIGHVLFRMVDYQDPRTQLAIKLLAQRLDSRPHHRGSYAWFVRHYLPDLKLAEKLYSSFSDPLQMDEFAVNYAGFLGNRELMKQVILNKQLNMDDRALMLFDYATEEGTTIEEAREMYRVLVAEDQDSYRLRRKYVDYLEKQKRYSEAQEVILDWLRSHDSSEGFPYIFARAGLAEMYRKEGQYEKAWEAVEPVVQSWQGYAMAQAVLALDRTGRTEEAIELGRAAVQRYQDNPYQLPELLEVFWRNGRYQEAADELKAYKYKISEAHWCWTIAPAFAEIFQDSDEQTVIKAVDALLPLPNRYPDCYALRLEDLGKCDLAVSVMLHLNEKKRATLNDLVDIYPCLKKQKGAASAQEWIRGQIPEKKFDTFIQNAVMEREFELVWATVPEPEKSRNPHIIWLNRAAACAVPGICSGEQITQLKEFLTSSKAESVFSKRNVRQGSLAVARYLAGLTSIDDVLSQVKDNVGMCNAAFYFGLKAETEDRYADASDWYRVAVETGLRGEFGYTTSYDTIDTWRSSGKSLSYLQKKRFGLVPNENQAGE